MAKTNCFMHLKVSRQYTTTMPSISLTTTEATTVSFFFLEHFVNSFSPFHYKKNAIDVV